jgi:hypothetical protein
MGHDQQRLFCELPPSVSKLQTGRRGRFVIVGLVSWRSTGEPKIANQGLVKTVQMQGGGYRLARRRTT